jgi:glutamine synthetase
MQAIACAGGQIKYGHSEVGNISGEDREMEQHEIEFSPVPLEDAADQIAIAKWMLRMIGHKYGVTITLAPKIMVGHAGSGLHIHSKLMKNGKNAMIESGKLSEAARKLIAGYLTLAPSLTSFANTVPTSYLRLVPHQEAPTNMCWGDRNRSVLVRVPLGWLGVNEMIRHANPNETGDLPDYSDSQTVEFRCPDGSANVYLLLAGLAVAARHGFEMSDSLEVADRLYVDVNIFASEHKKVQAKLPQLPDSCYESAQRLLEQRAIYEKDDVLPPGVIDEITKTLQSYDDKGLSERFYGKGIEIRRLVNEYLHCS